LVANGGFESGNFSGWTLSGDTTNQGVEMAAAFSGVYGAFFTTSPSMFPHILTQNLSTSAGFLYDWSFRAGDTAPTSGGSIQISWNGETLDFIDGGGGFVYRYAGLATTLASTPIQFGFSVGAGRLRLDEVSVDLHAAVHPADFNNDTRPDFVLFNNSSHQTVLWYLNNNTYLSGAFSRSLPAGWGIVGVDDFRATSGAGDRDGKPDYLLFNPTSRQTAVWYFNNNMFLEGATFPAIPSGWQLVGSGEFNGDGDQDFVVYNPTTRRTAVWFLNANQLSSSVYGPVLPAGWTLAAVADLDRDGRSDYVLFNPSTRQTVIWYLTGTTLRNAANGPTVAAGYVLAGTGDFNGDGKPDYVLRNDTTRRTVIWYLNNNTFVNGVYGPTLPSGWSLAAP
jgi:hypothetical protein